MKAFAVIATIALILLVGGGVTAGLIVASELTPSEPPPQAAVPSAELPQVDAPVETVRPTQSSVVVQQSGVDTLDSEQGRGLTAKPAVSGDVDGQFIIPEKTELEYPNGKARRVRRCGRPVHHPRKDRIGVPEPEFHA